MTMSVHLRENVAPFAKKGKPGDWQFVKVRNQILTQNEVQDISREIIEEADIRRDSFIEMIYILKSGEVFLHILGIL